MIRRVLTNMLGRGDELKQAIVVRTDVKMTKGKLAAQVAHAAVSAAEKSPYKAAWLREGQKKSVLKCAGLTELERIGGLAGKAGLSCALIEDAGFTQIPAGTVTCLGVGPAPAKDLDKVTGHLKLL